MYVPKVLPRSCIHLKVLPKIITQASQPLGQLSLQAGMNDRQPGCLSCVIIT